MKIHEGMSKWDTHVNIEPIMFTGTLLTILTIINHINPYKHTPIFFDVCLYVYWRLPLENEPKSRIRFSYLCFFGWRKKAGNVPMQGFDPQNISTIYVLIVPTAYGKRTIFIYSYPLEILPSTIRNRPPERRFVGDLFPLWLVLFTYLKPFTTMFIGHFEAKNTHIMLIMAWVKTHCIILEKDPQFCHGDTKYFGPIICSDSMGNPTCWHPKFGGPWWFDMEEWLICTHSHSWTSTSCLNHTGLANLNGDMFQTTPLIHFYYSSYMFLSWIS